MTQDEFQKVMQSIQVLDHFASTSDTLNTHRVWHANWVRAYETVGQQLSKLVEKPADEPAEKPTETSDKIAGKNPDPPPSKRHPEPPPPPSNETTTRGAPPPGPNKSVAKAPK